MSFVSEDLQAKLIAWRRDFHQYPEQGFLEMRTASIVADALSRLGFALRLGRDVMDERAIMGKPDAAATAAHAEWALANGALPPWMPYFRDGFTGIVADWHSGKPGPVTVFRVDMDALPIEESDDAAHYPKQQGFRSKAPGSMHACGHDGHTAIGLGLAHLIAANAEKWRGTLRLIFQPAEEGVRGAKSMMDAVNDADYFIAVHLGTGVAHRHFVAASQGFLATSKLDIRFAGKAAHAGMAPQEGRNALLAAASAALHIHGISRHTEGASRVNVGELHGGSGRNIIAGHASMKVETRGSNRAVNDYVRAQVEAIVAGAAMMYGVSVDIEAVGGAVDGKSDLELARMLAQAAEQSPWLDSVILEDAGALGSEDATYLMARVQERGGLATYCVVGTELAAGHHHERFDIREESLFAGVDVLYRSALHLNGD